MLQSAFWFLFFPTLGANLLTDYQISHEDYISHRPEIFLLLILCQMILAFVLLYGTACILSIGKRLLQAKSGRTRTSFKTVGAQARSAFFPLLLTGILRSILTILWAFLLIIPGIIYFFRTAFYPIIVVCEGLSYRPALERCTEISKGQLGSIVATIIGISFLTLFPAQVIAAILGYMAKDLGIGATIASNVASSLLISLALTLYFFALIGAYDYFKPKGHVKN